MARTRRRLALLAGVVALASIVFLVRGEPDYSQIPVPTIGTFERELEVLRERLAIPGMAAVIAQGDQIIWSRGFGLANVERRLAATPDTVFHLSSLTKPYAATVLLQLVDERRLNLETPAADLGAAMPPGSRATIRHVLSHTSDDPPGSRFRYDGQRYGALTAIVERVTGQSLAVVLLERIVRPLGLQSTAPNPLDVDTDECRATLMFRMMDVCGDAQRAAAERARTAAMFDDTDLDRRAIGAQLAQGYARRWGRLFWPSGLVGAHAPAGHMTTLFAGGGLVASALDVARFSMALDAGRLLQPETKALAFTAQRTTTGDSVPYGLGWFVQREADLDLIWHFGQSSENSTLLLKIPKLQATFVILANSDGLNRGRRLGDSGNALAAPAVHLFLNWFRHAADRPAP